MDALLQESLGVLEYAKVRELLGGCALTTLGKTAALALTPLPTPDAVAAALAEVDEAVGLLQTGGALPVGGAEDLQPVLKALGKPGTFVGPDQLQRVQASIQAAQACRSALRAAESAPRLQPLADDLDPLKPLGRALAEAIGPRGEILDGASFELGDIRQELRQTRQRVKQQLELMINDHRFDGVFQDKIVTQRNGRYVVPLKADHRGSLDGFVHDQSASGQTLFIEPVPVLPLNNRVRTLIAAEKQEEERVLRRLCQMVAADGDALAQNQTILTHLDLRGAAARLSRRLDGCSPKLVRAIEFDLKKARHPLLILQPDGGPREGRVTPIDLRLSAKNKVLVISGPNTGGKSVALKTLGLLVLMVRSGLHIPCDPDSRIHLFGQVFADIGDEQSIEASLSTFSGHLERMKRILANADRDSLVLLDEAGTGTDPAEGGALALAMLDTLRKRGSRVVLTTHLSMIKGYAQLQGGVENAAVDFDPETLQPTYRLLYGVPGASNAFSIARQLGVPEEVLSVAGDYLGKTERESGAIVDQLHQLKAELQAELAEAQKLKRQAESEKKRQRQSRRAFEKERKQLRQQAVDEATALVRDGRKQLDQVLSQARDASSIAPPDSARLKGELRALETQVAAQQPVVEATFVPAKEVEAGEWVQIPSLGLEGQVVNPTGRQIELEVQGKRMRLPLKALKAFQPRRFEAPGEKRIRGRIERESFSATLKIIGLRVDEALPLVERFLDDALLRSQRVVEIVHGSGEGILRKAVRELLAQHREVEAFYAADQKQGGENVTVVELKQG